MHPFLRGALAGWLLIGVCLSARGQTTGCHLHVGLDTWAPYQFRREPGGAPRGLDVRLIRLYGKLANCHITFEWQPWARSLRELRQGNLDMVPGASITAKRRRYGRFSIAYRTESMRLFMTRKAAGHYHFHAFPQMVAARFHLVVTRNYYYGQAFKQAMTKPEFATLVTKVPRVEQAFKMLGAGHTQGCLADSLVGRYWIHKLGLEGKVRMTDLEANRDRVHLLFSRKSVSADVVKRFNRAIRKARSSGAYQRLVAQYRQ